VGAGLAALKCASHTVPARYRLGSSPVHCGESLESIYFRQERMGEF
jgi:hypothetical protein